MIALTWQVIEKSWEKIEKIESVRFRTTAAGILEQFGLWPTPRKFHPRLRTGELGHSARNKEAYAHMIQSRGSLGVRSDSHYHNAGDAQLAAKSARAMIPTHPRTC